MRLQDDLDFTTLNWVKQELDETLKQARQALEAYVEDPADSSLMRFCATYLHQVQGTLRMVELYGAAMVVEEMERVANALLENQIAQKDEAYAVLMRGIVQLPDYLERLQGGHKDIPIVLLPLLNDLRAARGEKLLSESVLFSPDLSAPLPPEAAGPDRPVPELELKAITGRLRTTFQTALLQWLKDQGGNQPVNALLATLDRLRALTTQEEARRLWWVAAGVLDAVLAGGIEASAQLKQAIGKVDREIRRLSDVGESSFRVEPPRELTKNLLYYVAHCRLDTPRVRALKDAFGLDALMPSEREIEHAKGTLSGKNRALLDTVSQAIKEDLMRVKDALDLHLRTQDAQPSALSAQSEVLDRVADTLGMLGLGVPRRVVQEQRTLLQDVAAGARPADEGTLLDIAGALLYVEASLDENIRSLGAAEEPIAKTGAGAELELPQAEVRRILEALMKEAQGNLAQAKQDIVAFVESPWDHAKVTGIPKLLDEIGGAMRMLSLDEPARLVHALVRFVEIELLRLKRVPTSEQMEKLADSLASIEYYLEAVRDQRAGRDRILDVTRRSLEALGYWPLPPDSELEELAGVALEQAPAPVAAPAAPSVPAPSAPAPVAAVPASPPPVVAAPPAPAPAPVRETPVAPPVRVEPDFSGLEVDVGGISFATPTAGGSDAFREELEPAQPGQFTAVDVPAEAIDQFIERLDRGEQPPAVEAPTTATAGERPAELTSVVEIAEGADLAALMLGEPAMQPVQPPPPPHDVAGLKFAETRPIQAEYAGASAAASDAEEDYEWVDIEEEVEVDEGASAASDGGFAAVPSDDIDDEIREVFVEEVQEEIDNVGRQLPVWKLDPTDFEKLKPIRRSFHTLKGSGRLVGALALGEFSWKVENMLNRVLDKTVAPSPAVMALLDAAFAALPQMLTALKGEGAPRADIAGIMGVADKLAAGEDAWLQPPRKVKVKQVRRVRVAKPRPAPVEQLTQTFDITRPLEEEVALPEIGATAPVELPEIVETAAPLGEGEGVAMPVLDPMLLEILSSEVEGHLGAVREYLAACDAAGAPQPAPEVLLRAVHTLHGAVSMADVPVINDVVGPLEGYIKRLRGAGHAPSATGLAAIREAADLIERVVGLLDRPGVRLPAADALGTTLTTLRDELPEPQSPFTVFDLALEDEDETVTLEEPVADVAAAVAVEPSTPTEAVLDEAAAMDALVAAYAEETAVVAEPPNAADRALEGALAGLATVDVEQPETVPAAPVEESLEAFTDVDDLLAVEAPVAEEPALAAEAADALEPGLVEDLASLEAFASETPISPESTLTDFAAIEEPAPFAALEDELTADVPVSAFDDAAALEAALAEALAAGEVDAQAQAREETERAAALDAQLAALAAEAEARQAAEAAALAAEAEAKAREAAPVEEPRVDLTAVTEIPAVHAPEPAPVAVASALEDVDPEGPLVLPDMDEDLIEVFVEEGNDILDQSDSLVARLRDDPSAHDAVGGLQRHLHTIKGNARAVGLTGIGDLAHAMESLLEGVAGERMTLDRTAVALLERGFDRLHRQVGRVGRRQAVGIPAATIARFEALVAGEPLPADMVPVAPSAAAEIAPAVEPAPAPVDVVVPVPVVEAEAEPEEAPPIKPAAPRPLPAVAPEEEMLARAPQEMIRVRSDLLDALVNFAGEVSIYRSRLEQQMGTFRFNLIELDQTVLRLREQLRKMEIETEAQIIARFQREAEASQSEFDPLELDRFSTLQQYSRALAESVSDLVALQNALDDQTRQAETLLLQQSRVSSELQEGLMRTRMVPFDSVVPFLRRLIRQTSDELGKRANLKIEGAQGEMDRNLLERMKAPFEHMLRNALAHGIEQPADRRAAGKPEEGTVRIAVSREATEVVIRVSDDGKGMDRDAIRRKAIERGLMRADAQLSDRDLFGFVLETGFSTAEQVTKIAGRGVGMDVVANEIKQLGGSLAIDSQRGRGTEFTIRLPFTLAVTQAIMVRLGEQVFAVPMSSVQGVARIAHDDLERRLGTAHPVFAYAGEEYAIHDLAALLGVSHHRAIESAQHPLLLTRSGDSRAAIRIDSVVGSREIVVKSVGPQVSSVPGIFGATIMGDGSVVMILDLAPLARRSAALREERRVAMAEEGLEVEIAPVAPTPAAEARRQPLVMVVDDSITMRKVTSRVLERHDMEVVTAKDGLDAVEKLQERIPDLMLLDIEMPRMDGYELATYMRNDARLKGVPIIMITSRTGEKHRQRAFEIGVDRYLGKPYQEADLLRNVEETLNLTRPA